MKTIILNWYGPYNEESICDEKEFCNGLYLITGKQLYEREPTIQYCGITQNSFYNRFKNHHKKDFVTRDREYWLSDLEYPKKTTKELLELSETIIIYFWQPSLNDRKKNYLPEKPTTVISKWFKISGEPRINQKSIYKELSDTISWDGDLWRTGNLKVWAE